MSAADLFDLMDANPSGSLAQIPFRRGATAILRILAADLTVC
jgi:hypothetical protein